MRLEINYKKKNNCKKYKHMEAKQYATEQPIGQKDKLRKQSHLPLQQKA